MLLTEPSLRPFLHNLTLLAVCIYLPYVVGVGVFEVKLGEMHNPGGREANNKCCAGSEDNGKCTTPCNTRIITCLRQYSPAHPADCTYGNNKSGILGRNSFVLTTGNLVRFPISSNWPGSFNLKVLARVSDTNQTIIEAILKRKSFGANPQWGNYTYTMPSSGGLTISIRFSYRFMCSKNNYGDDCAKTCIPRNDKFGHYRCDADGKRVCLDGWGSGASDTFCEKPICNPSCKHGGRCDAPNTCSCPMGWQGASCDECQTYPGCVHGTCQKKWDCNCNSGWGGAYCDLELDYCGIYKPCKHGDCINTTPGRYKCLCYKGYGGLNCESEINECASNPCKNGGNCTDKFAGYSCSCPSGFNGTQCELNIDDCKANACANGGTCIDGINSYKCRCPVGFTGKTCNVMLPTETPLLTTESFNNTHLTTASSHVNDSVVVGQRKDNSSSWRSVANIVIPVVICVIIFVCIIIGCIVWKFCRNRCCCCASTSSRDPEEPNTLTEVKRVESDGKELSDMHDIKRCRASTSHVKNTTPDIIINFVPSRPNQKNTNTEKTSRTRKGKEVDSLPLEKTRFAKPSNRSQETVT